MGIPTLAPVTSGPFAGELVRRAYAFAERAHSGQRRKDGQAYIFHPVRVARLLASHGYDAEVVAAALLHDVVEDTQATLEEIRVAFGPRVALLVHCVSEEPGLTGAERKAAYRERIRLAPRDAGAICAADKVCNLADLRAAAASDDHVTLQRFHGGLHAQVQRFQAELQVLAAKGVDARLTEALRSGVRALRDEARRLGVSLPQQHALAA
jgi:(p)ppGpp synthase/HD superfamily hydrolase